MAITKGQVEITDLDAWERHAGPKHPDQWVDDRSAKELARAWLDAGAETLPDEVSTALAAHPAFGTIVAWDAEPERKLRFDQFRGEPRNTDLLVVARDQHGEYVIGVEGKADEPFAETVADTLSAALERTLQNPNSNGIARVEQLARALFGGEPFPGCAKVGDLRYQLLTASAGILCEAERRDLNRALLLVHEFITAKTDDKLRQRNAADLNAYLKRLSRGAVMSLREGEIGGPIFVPAIPLLTSSVALYVGKVVRDLRSSQAEPPPPATS